MTKLKVSISHFTFHIKELPEVIFVPENWHAANDSMLSEWRECEAGELK
ncbi:hypothetical protein [Pseudoalteromonas luteoviolacea]|uniref:Uncharacterized protein n=1 Tax=Pseudoalteromonas luteoviolacea NCIMB 1942 TaxID=1365253 RepID=A0A167BGW0_9GAMM|nr:hypothetical protein [Pseudoalteromonas luteoviolacea]KZN46524.1 hypothetical protein N482_12090 [Pseudoalteromonas luteoviolacea NCIMB 1942]